MSHSRCKVGTTKDWKYHWHHDTREHSMQAWIDEDLAVYKCLESLREHNDLHVILKLKMSPCGSNSRANNSRIWGKGTEITSTKDDLTKSRGLKFTWLPDEGSSKTKCPFWPTCSQVFSCSLMDSLLIKSFWDKCPLALRAG